MRKIILISMLACGIMSVGAQAFEESMGGVTANTKINDHQAANGFKNSNTLIFSGSAEVQLNGAATNTNKYSTPNGEASKGANIRISDIPGTDFMISGINTTGLKNPTLGFGILKGIAHADGADLAVEYSLDGKKWKSLRWEPLPVGEGSALIWMYRTTNELPKADKLSIRFRQTGGGSVYRLDDVGVIAAISDVKSPKTVAKPAGPGLISTFEESMGNVSANISIDDHMAANGFKNSNTLIFSGSAEVQLNGAATNTNKYSTPNGEASKGANIRISNTQGTDFMISGINTTGLKKPTLGFGILKGIARFDGSDLAVEYSIDGVKWKSLRWEPLPVDEDSALKWMYRSTNELPQAERLSIRFRQTGGGCVYRIDDVSVFEK